MRVSRCVWGTVRVLCVNVRVCLDVTVHVCMFMLHTCDVPCVACSCIDLQVCVYTCACGL